MTCWPCVQRPLRDDSTRCHPPAGPVVPRCGVVLASGGYPGAYETGKRITDLESVDEDILVFHAGTRYDESSGELVTAGGRVMCVVAGGATLLEARQHVYANVDRIHFAGAQWRSDIAAREQR